MKTPRKYKTLGLLDLYGFESLAEDPGGFEQLVFNFAAEKVQRVTFEWTMVLEQQEYTLEGVEWTHLGMVSHKMLLITIFGHKHLRQKFFKRGRKLIGSRCIGSYDFGNLLSK